MKARPTFLSAWLRNPIQVGAVLPSSNGLTSTMAAQTECGSGITIELGAGTGAVTSALLTRGIQANKLVLIEKDRILAKELSQHFPHLRVLEGDAARLKTLLQRSELGIVDNVVSSLPLLNMRHRTRVRILKQIFSVLHPEGKYVQFTYSLRPPITERLAHSLDIDGERTDRILLNLPPAHVWVYKRRDLVSPEIY
ncbi:MAG: methyltransferase domain-containing protein [Candidatus Thiodiazotropha sp.]